jgi:hypothetical protein
MDVFISYSRRNLAYVEMLAEALQQLDKDVWFDQIRQPLRGIPPGSKWWNEVKYGIQSADNFLFIISPNSITSPYCHAEIGHALHVDKRIVTVLYCGEQSEADTLHAIGQAIEEIPAGAQLPSSVSASDSNVRSLARRNWLEISQVHYVVFADTLPFARSLEQLNVALNLDLAWVKARSQLRQAVQLWADNEFQPAYLWPEERLRSIRSMIGRAQPKLDDLEFDFLRPEQERLLEELEEVGTTHLRRMAIGERLALIGDTRPGVGLRPDGLPDIVWCPVPDGSIHIIGDPVFGHTSDHTTKSFFIARYPVTYAQFQAFVDDPKGYANDRWWLELAVRPSEPSGQRTQFANNPRDNVSWYECVAFARWLNARLPHNVWPKGTDDTWEIRLPTEWEWQQAATGGNPNNVYPWGRAFGGQANTYEAGLNRAIAVGMYPAGAAPCGALDMSGNLYEWCLNLFDSRRVQLSGQRRRALRGGAFLRHSDDATTSERIGEKPDMSWDIKFGFRVACGPQII